MNGTLGRIHSRIAQAEAGINDLEDRMVEVSATEWNIEKGMKRREHRLRGPWDNVKHTNIHIIESQKGKREKGPEKISKGIISEKFPNMGKEIVNQVQEAKIVPGRINPRRNTLRHIVIKLTKIKDRHKVLKAAREKQQIT